MKGNSSVKYKTLSGFAWKFGERISAQLVSFIVSIILARILSPEHYGIVAMVTVFINIANVFVTSGFSTSLIQKKDASETDFSTIFYCSLAVSVILYLILFLLAPIIADFYDEQLLTSVIRVFSIKILISAYNSVQHAYVSRHMLFRKFFFSTLIGTIVSGVIGIIMAYMGFGVWAIVSQYLVNSMMDTIVLAFTIPWKPRIVFSYSSAKSLMNFGWKILAADLIGTIFNNLRSLLIGKIYTSADLAYYNKGQQIPNLISTNVDSTINSVLFPVISNENSDLHRVKQLTRQSMKVSSFIIFPLMAGLAAVAEPLTVLLLTEKWKPMVPYMQLLCISNALGTITNVNLQSMRAVGSSDVVLKLELIKKPIALIIILVAVKINVFAVAVSMPVYSLCAAIINMQPNNRLFDYSMKEQILDLLPATLLSLLTFVIASIPLNIGLNTILTLMIQVIIGGVVYIGLAALFKVDTFCYLFSTIKKILFGSKKHLDK